MFVGNESTNAGFVLNRRAVDGKHAERGDNYQNNRADGKGSVTCNGHLTTEEIKALIKRS